MNQVLDYSAGFPGAANIKRAGYVGAVRYIGFPDRRKCTTRAELADFDANQIGMALVFEQNAGNWRGGLGQGRIDGRRARDHANDIEFPTGCPIYMAVDQDVVRTGEFNVMASYLQGTGEALGGKTLTGVYGEVDVIDKARQAGVATWFWQTAAWSHGRRTTAHLFQHVGTVSVGWIGCDVSDVLTPNWGQHNYEGATVSAQDVTDGLTQVHYGALGDRNVIDALGEVLKRVLVATDTTLPAVLSAAQVAANNNVGAFTDTQVTTLGTQLALDLSAKLGPATAEYVLAEASRRLAGE